MGMEGVAMAGACPEMLLFMSGFAGHLSRIVAEPRRLSESRFENLGDRPGSLVWLFPWEPAVWVGVGRSLALLLLI